MSCAQNKCPTLLSPSVYSSPSAEKKRRENYLVLAKQLERMEEFAHLFAQELQEVIDECKESGCENPMQSSQELLDDFDQFIQEINAT